MKRLIDSKKVQFSYLILYNAEIRQENEFVLFHENRYKYRKIMYGDRSTDFTKRMVDKRRCNYCAYICNHASV